ncbi:hypothetical protein DRO03_01460 [Methanosarcinales archaeon]|nr:MAG: hypothetical protein DRO03_01460 [Methanosarcinales archaeon]
MVWTTTLNKLTQVLNVSCRCFQRSFYGISIEKLDSSNEYVRSILLYSSGFSYSDLGVDFLRSIRALERRYEKEVNIELRDGALYDRFTPELVEFLRECVLHAIEFQAQQQSRVLGAKLNGFKDIIIQDSSII